MNMALNPSPTYGSVSLGNYTESHIIKNIYIENLITYSTTENNYKDLARVIQESIRKWQNIGF